MNSEKGIVNIATLAISLSAIGVIAFLLISSVAPIKQSIFQNLANFKPTSAQTINTTVTFTVAGRTDVFNQDGSDTKTYNNGSKNWIGTGKNTASSYLGLRFTGQVPANATLVSAKLHLVTTDTAWIPISANIYAEDNIAPQTFSSSNPPSKRSLTSSFQTYANNVQWTKGQGYDIDVTTPIKEVLSKETPAAISLIVRGSGSAYGRKFFYSSGSNIPQLVLVFSTTTSVTPTSTPPTATPTPTGAPVTSPTSTPTPTPSSTGGGVNSSQMGLWTPNPKYDTCTQQFHDSFSVIGPDGKRYPTWHPPVAYDPATGKTCSFGHEHGRDPSGSALYAFAKQYFAYNGDTADAGLPFGYVNVALDDYNTAHGISNGTRHEDHFGHKIEWENGVKAQIQTSSGRVTLNVTCDFLYEIHQGTHSPDAFTNNLHELEYLVQCSDPNNVGVGTFQFAGTKLSVFGIPGQLTAACDKTTVYNTGSYSPSNSPSGDGARFLPTKACADQYYLVPDGQFSDEGRGLYEDWVSSNYLKKSDGSILAYFDPHFAVFNPSRFYWPGHVNPTTGLVDNLGRSIDLCYMTDSNGDQAHSGSCDGSTNYGQIQNLSYDDPRSVFNGSHREVYFNQTWVNNANSTNTWYTDPFGNQASTAPFTGSVKQYIPAINNYNKVILESQAFGSDRDYGGNGVHAPN